MGQQRPAVSTPAEGVAVSVDEAIARWRDAMTVACRAPKTIAVYIRHVTNCASSAGWKAAEHIDWAGASSFLAARRRDGWGNATTHQAVCALRSFGDFLRRSGLRTIDPLADLDLPRKREATHKHPFTADEARRFLAVSIARCGRSKRARGCAPLVWFTMFVTGLRHSEIAQVRWRDIVLDADLPGIWTDPAWEGNKAQRRDWIPLHPTLARLLRAHRQTVPRGPDEPVFPIIPIRNTWEMDRAAAGLPEHDEDGRIYSPHATRASLATWLGQAGVQEGLRQTIMRHRRGLTEGVYTVRSKAEMADAIASIPVIWPDHDTGLQDENFFPDSPQAPCTPDPIVYPEDVAAKPPTKQTSQGLTLGSSEALTDCAGPDPGLADSPAQGAGDSIREPLFSDAITSDPLVIECIRTLNLVIRRALGSAPQGAADVRHRSDPKH